MNFQQKNGLAGLTINVSGSPVLKAFMAGSFSGTCSTLLFQPLDLVKTRIQQVEARRGMVKVINDVIAKESLFGLWRGVAPSLVRTVPGVGIYFSCMHTMKTTLCNKVPTPTQSLMVGAFSRALAGCIMIPFTVIKIRSESGQFEYKNIFAALRAIKHAEGMRGLTSGLIPTLWRDVPFSGLYLMFYEQLKAISVVKSSRPDLDKFVCGLGAGVLASTVTQPADVVKTRLQLNKGLTVLTVVKDIAAKEGAQGFFRGCVPRMLRRTMMAALAWGVYEQVMKNMGIK